MKISRLFLFCALGLSSKIEATTLVVFYTPADGAIIATDSAIGFSRLGDTKGGRAIPNAFGTECKIATCRGYFVAGAGFGKITDRNEVARVCNGMGPRTGIDAFMQAMIGNAMEEINKYVSYLVQTRQAPPVGHVLASVAIAGYDNSSPVLRYFDVSFGGSANGKIDFRLSRKTACPGDSECTQLSLIVGEKQAALDRQGQYKNKNDLLRLAEELVQLEIDANQRTRYVAGPISIIQIKPAIGPVWFRNGLCKSER